MSDIRFETFCETIYPAETGLLAELEDYAKNNDVPIIRPGARRYLRWLLKTTEPKRVLELGTAIGFSAILMAQAATDAHITTIENYEKRIPVAKENLAKSGCSDRITLIEGDAAEVLKSMTDESFDLVFVDAAKAQYETYLKLVMPFLHKKSIIVFDNVLAADSGSTMDSRYAIERRDRTIHERMRTLLKNVTADENFATDLMTSGDGIFTVTVL